MAAKWCSLLLMSTPKKKKPVNAAPASTPRKRQLPARAGDELWNVLQAIAKEERRSMAQTVIILLEEALRARGKWDAAIADDE